MSALIKFIFILNKNKLYFRLREIVYIKWHETGGSDCLTKTQDSAKCNY